MSTVVLDISVFVVMLVLALWGLVRYVESVGVFFPSRRMEVDPAAIGLAFDNAYFKTPDHITLNGWFVQHPQGTSTIIFAHGNAGNMADRLFKLRFLYDLGLNVLIFDYRGYGRSEGRPSEKGIYRDAQAAYDYLQSRGDVDMARIILYGASIGGVAAIDLACHREVALLVIEASITNAADMAHIHYPFVPSFFLSLKFDSLGKVKALKMPKLFIHSPDDEIVPYWVGQKLFDAASAPKEFLAISGGHNDGSMTTDAVATAEFVRILKSKDLL